MPNYCDFDMRIRGNRKSVATFATWLKADYHYSGDVPEIYVEIEGEKIPVEHHIGWRVFECYYDLEPFKDLKDDRDVTLYISGYCAWSVYSCMLTGPFSYCSDNHDECIKKYGKDYSLTLPQACKKLSLEAEVFSNEPGMCFAEHYHITPDGELVTDEETQYLEFYIEEYESYEEYAKSFDDSCPVTKAEFEKARKAGDSCIVKCDWLKSDAWPFKLI